MKKYLSILLIFTMIFSLTASSFAESKTNYYNEFKEKAEFVKNSKPEAMAKFNAMRNGTLESSDASYKSKLPFNLEVSHTENFEVDGVEFERIFYKKPTSSDSYSSLTSISSRAAGPEEGDFAIIIAKGDPSGKDWFDDAEGYLSYLRHEGKYKLASYATYAISKTVYNFFTNQAIDLLEAGHKGKGLASSIERRVIKWG